MSSFPGLRFWHVCMLGGCCAWLHPATHGAVQTASGGGNAPADASRAWSSPTGPGSPRAAQVFPEAPERGMTARVCTPCHAPELVVAQRHTPGEWDDIIARMVDHGAQATEAEQQLIFAYLVRFYGSKT